ncbi:hypothetical protein C0033_00345 [Clostridium sp. chh4-2]|nr:hypothetical protein C0033_00345 [Clostridium sp. chh4-2]
MGRISDRIGKKCREWTARNLIIVLLCLNGMTAFAPVTVYASPDTAGDREMHLSPEILPETEDLWENLESQGEVIIAFPSQIEAAISSSEDEDRYSFRLEDETDVTISLESEYPCGLELISEGRVIGVSRRPFSQILEPSGLEMGTYTVRVVPLEGVESSSYTLRVAKQANRKKIPDYSEAHMAGTSYDPKSPFRFTNTKKPEDKDKGGQIVNVIHYLAHWQGPVDESVVPYYSKGDFAETPSDYIYYKKAEPKFHEQNALVLPGSERSGYIEHWKNAIMTYGAIDTGLLFSYNYFDKNEGNGYPELDYQYFYVPKEDWNYDRYGGHAVLVIGWDDTIKKENFRVTERNWDAFTGDGDPEEGIILEREAIPEHDGAWICRDSYGSDLETRPAYYYVSYESSDFGTSGYLPTVFAPGEKNDNYNHLYSNSAGGLIDDTFKNSGFLRGVQVFHNEDQEELLRAVGFVVAQGECSYEIGVRIGEGSIEKVKSGYLKYGGYHTVRLEDGIQLPKDTDFEIHVALSCDDDKNLWFYGCRNTEGWVDGIKAIPGKSFYYTSWDEDAEQLDASAEAEYPCIYAYTYSPLKSAITILDNKEDVEEYHFTAELSSDTELNSVSKQDKATASDAGNRLKKATDSNADERLTDSDTGNRFKKATGSNADERLKKATDSNADADEDEVDEVLEDDREENKQDKEAEWKEILKMLEIRAQDEGVIPLETAEMAEIAPLDLDFPERYDSRDYHLITKAKHQGNSSICWSFAAAGALEASYLRYGNQLIDYPRGLNIKSQEETITNGTISLKLKKGQEIPLNLSADLYSDNGYFHPGSPQIYWEITGDMGSVEAETKLSESGEEAVILIAQAPGKVTVTAVSMADMSLKASCRIEIIESVPAKVYVRPERLAMNVGETQKLETTVEADEKLTVLYSSSRPDIVSVDKDGTVLALKPGTASVTAKAGDGQAVCQVRVRGGDGSGDDDSEPVKAKRQTANEDTAHGYWEQNVGGWRFLKDDGSYARSSWEKIGGIWYYFKEDCFAASGWLYLGEVWYYLSQDAETYGKMETGWLYDPSFHKWFYMDESGAMAVGWHQIDEKWYYFHTVSDGGKGRMYAGEQTPDGYMTGPDGEWVR